MAASMDIQLCSTTRSPVADQPFEYVERKGLGHPDSICDAVMETAATALSQAYVQRCGRVLHYNLDKALLVAGQTAPKLGGGQVISPLQIIAGDRATSNYGDTTIPVDEIVESAVLKWFSDQLRFVDTQQHVTFRSEIKPGSAELTGIFDRDTPVANDTSAAVGFAPLTETERIVLATEHYLNSAGFKDRYPVAGEDVKIMAVRHGAQLRLTIAMAMVDQFISSASNYFEQKEAIRNAALHFVQSQLARVGEVEVDLNTLDDATRGEAGMYLTVLGTSAESGDGGEVGRGNAVNGLISLNRPTSNEAAAGKNATCHVGKIYNHLSHAIAGDLVASIQPVQEAYVWLCSQIGRPVDQPWSTSVELVLAPSAAVADVQANVEAIVQQHLREAANSSSASITARR
jgi:S-adenosylmethionine synthetase